MDRRGEETHEKAADRLKEIFKGFSSDKKKFVELVHGTRKVAEEIQEHLTRNVDDKRFKENIATLLKETEEVDQVMNQEPSIIVVGQTKSGKSSFINELLERTILAADQRPCTARLTQLEHVDVDLNEKPRVIIVSQGGRVLSEERLLKKYIPAELVNLPFEKRENKEEVYAKVVARIENDFLKSGVRIIDSPGRNENSLLDDLVMDHMKTILPLVIYVIDGRNQLTLRDKEDINSILGQTLPENMFFVVTKIEADDEDESSSEEESDEGEDDEDEYGKEIEEKETKNKKTVYRKLCDEKFLDGSVAMEDCPRFHGLSAWKIKTQRKKNETKPNRYTKAFERFKNCLVDFTKKQLQYHIDCAAKSLADNHKMCIDVFIDEANRIYNERQAYKNTVERAESSEESLYQNILGKIRGDGQKLEEVIKGCLGEDTLNKIKKDAAGYRYKPYRKKKRNSMISSTESLPSDGAAATMTYDGKMVYGIEETDVIEITVPENGFISNGELVHECRRQIEQFVYDKLGNSLSQEVWAHFSGEDGLLNQMWSDLSNLKLEDADGQSATVESLKGMMIKNYRFDPEKEHFEEKLKMKIKNALRNLLRRFVGMIKGEMGRTGVGKPEWKEEVAGDSLEKVSATRIKDGVISKLIEHIKSGHESFRKEIRMMKEVYKKQLELGTAARREIRAYTPRIAALELRTIDLVERHIYGIPKCIRTLGSGTQGSVHTTELRGSKGEKLAMKIIRGRSTGKTDPLDKIATEVHHLRQLSHPNLAKLHGCIILSDTSQDVAKVPSTEIGMLIEEMKGDLLDLLPQYSNLNDRLKMALEAGYAVRYLHQREMIHRDIKPANVLLGENDRVVLTDFGCCKPIGLMDESMLGTPLHMAPEMLTRETHDYDNRVDIYAFGVFLWYCVDGSGKHPIDTTVEDNVGVVFQNTRLGRRPRREAHFPEEPWKLMQRCWAENPQERPTMNEVCAELERIINQK